MEVKPRQWHRKKWNEDLNKALIRTYFKVTKLETFMLNYRKRLLQAFMLQYPNIGVSEHRISAQRRHIIQNKLLSPETINSLREEVSFELQMCGPKPYYNGKSPSMAITVKVEVEPLDEDPIDVVKQQPDNEDTVTIKTELFDAEEDVIYIEQNSEQSTTESAVKYIVPPKGTVVLTESKINNIIRRRVALAPEDTFKIDRKKVFEELDKISTTAVVDKILAMEVRNTWGHIFHENHIDSAINNKIYICLSKWVTWSLPRGDRDTPVSYSCYICGTGWWYLAPFRDHVNSNHENVDLQIKLEIVKSESYVVAKLENSLTPTKINIRGACPKCGGDPENHKFVGNRFGSTKYGCPYCTDLFATCTLWSQHMGSCEKYIDHVRMSPVIDNLYTCHLCSAVRETVEMIEEHYIYSHSVRSDIPAFIIPKFCITCGQLTHCYLTHPCPVKKPSGFCAWCVKGFTTRPLLRLHEAINKEPTQCLVCLVKLPSKCSVFVHLAQKHSDNFLMVPKCVLCVENTVFLNDWFRNAHIELHHDKHYDKRRYGMSVIIPKKCVPSKNIPPMTVNPSTSSDSRAHNTKAPKITPNTTGQDSTPSDNLNQIVVKEICGNFVDSTDDDSQLLEGEYINNSSVFFASSTVKIKTERLDAETELLLQQIKEEKVDAIEETITEHETDSYETIVKEEGSPDAMKYEDVLATMLGMKKEGSDEHTKEDTPEEIEGDLLQEMISSNIQSDSDDSEIVEYTPLTSYFSNKDNVECIKCLNQFSPFQYKLHLQYCCKRVYCTTCNRHYEDMADYCLHFANEHGFERQQCPICRGCNIKQSFVAHFKRHVVQTFVPVRCLAHTKDGPKLKIEYQCKRCLEKVDMYSVLAHWELHYSLAYSDDVNNDGAKPTVKAEANEDGVENKCVKEDIEKIIEVLLKKEVQSRRNFVKGARLACIVCKKLCQRIATYKIHLIEHLLNYARRNCGIHNALQCPICQVNLNDTNKFRQHMRDHAGLLSYTCTMCKKNFGNASNFAKHKKTHNYNIVPCEVCGKKFHQNYQLKKHLEMHLSLGSITCSCCNKLFFDESSHKRHLRVQALKKNPSGFSCKLCKEKFKNTKTLKDHEWKEHKIRRYKADCPMCKQPFRKFLDLKQHMKEKHFVKCNKKGWNKLIGTRSTLEKIEH